MTKRGKSGPDFGPLEIRAAGAGRVLSIMVFALLGSVDMAFSDGGSVPGKIFFGFACAVAVLIVVLSVSSRRKGCLVRLDDAGVTLFGGQTVSWSAISEVRDIRKKQILVFLPRDGAVLPMLSVGMLVRPHILEKRLTRRWGSPLVLAPRALDASADEIIDAVRRFSGGVPVLDEERQLATG